MRSPVVDYCAAIGADPLLVQGAGGNVSWKDGATLWVKASGMWLADAARKDVFVPVDLRHLKTSIARGDFDIAPKPLMQDGLKPSIETLLHAVMPHTIVVHLHAIEILAWLVRGEFESDFTARLGSSVRWASVPYLKPGAELARAVGNALEQTADADVLFLRNHGVLLGGENVADVDALLSGVIDALKTPLREGPADVPRASSIPRDGAQRYGPVPDAAVQHLALDNALFDRLESDWALYPDHVVFLGARPRCYEDIDALRCEISTGGAPELAFVRGDGVYAGPGFNAAKQAQLRCYYDVLSRQPPDCVLNPLDDRHIAALLDWDAEQYRVRLAR
jgi:rhamnose utilization protein RhaD (predicted bifunctional aldolase and dehydrogenase)